MKICTVVGARPQFIKAAALSRVLRGSHKEILIHTGQHYDANMSDVFFEELSIPQPDYNLAIAGGSHGQMTGRMLMAIEEVLLKEKPGMVLVYGDTNSTLAGALAPIKLHIPVCHVEAGARMRTFDNPEEVNRVLVDRVSKLLMCCTQMDVHNLAKEGIHEGVYNTGDLMYDAVLFYGQNLNTPKPGDIINFDGNNITLPPNYYLLTCHREENTGTDKPLLEIFKAMNQLDAPCIYPVHPRNKRRAEQLKIQHNFKNIILTQPVGYLTSLYLVKNAKKIVTDSGGLQREAWFFNRQCITLLEKQAWPFLLEGNINQMSPPLEKEIISKLEIVPDFSKKNNQFGDGHAAQKITEILINYERRL